MNEDGEDGGKSSSLPSRERGLKWKDNAHNIRYRLSLPSRERGLKLNFQMAEQITLRRSPRGSVD